MGEPATGEGLMAEKDLDVILSGLQGVHDQTAKGKWYDDGRRNRKPRMIATQVEMLSKVAKDKARVELKDKQLAKTLTIVRRVMPNVPTNLVAPKATTIAERLAKYTRPWLSEAEMRDIYDTMPLPMYDVLMPNGKLWQRKRIETLCLGKRL